jgi:hypothetical protein
MSTPSQGDRLQAIEDRLAIYTLIASHPPSADTAAANYTREVYTEDGVFDRGPKLEGAKGIDAIASFTLKPEHKEAIQGGLAHFAGLPLIDLRGDEAIVTSYLQILCLDHQGEPRDCQIMAFRRVTVSIASSRTAGSLSKPTASG